MHKHAKTFHANNNIQTSLFLKQKFVVHFSDVIYTKTRSCTHPNFR